jgi:hypothetical protein
MALTDKGDGGDIFFIADVEAGVKQALVDDKPRRKEILAELKAATKEAKALGKVRKGHLATFTEMNASRATTQQDMTDFFARMLEERVDYQDGMFDVRIELASRFSDDEWAVILEHADAVIDKRDAKAEEKKQKGKKTEQSEYLAKTRAAVMDNLAGDDESALLAELDEMLDSNTKRLEGYRAINGKNDVFVRKNATRDELGEVAGVLNELRGQIFESLLGFHMTAEEHTTEEQWDAIMKVFNKELSITGR